MAEARMFSSDTLSGSCGPNVVRLTYGVQQIYSRDTRICAHPRICTRRRATRLTAKASFVAFPILWRLCLP